MKILLCAPSETVATSLNVMFSHLGIRSEVCSNVDQARRHCQSERYGAVIFWHESDPEGLLEGYAAWKRESAGGQFIVVTSRQSGVERAKFLEAGVDKYLIAPFSYAKLAGDLLVREFENGYDNSCAYSTNHFFVQPLARTISCDGLSLNLTRKEFDILTYLLCNRGRTLSRIQIWDEAWDCEQEITLSNPIDVHILRIRKKLPETSRYLIRTMPGIGYRMHAEA